METHVLSLLESLPATIGEIKMMGAPKKYGFAVYKEGHAWTICGTASNQSTFNKKIRATFQSQKTKNVIRGFVLRIPIRNSRNKRQPKR